MTLKQRQKDQRKIQFPSFRMSIYCVNFLCFSKRSNSWRKELETKQHMKEDQGYDEILERNFLQTRAFTRYLLCVSSFNRSTTDINVDARSPLETAPTGLRLNAPLREEALLLKR